MLSSLLSAQYQSQGAFLTFAPLIFVKPAQVKLHLSLILCLEFTQFQFDRNQTAHTTVIEQQVKIVVFAINGNPLLARCKCKIRSKLKQKPFKFPKDGSLQIALAVGIGKTEKIKKIWVSKHKIRSHAVFIAQ